jgi:hypothetical protein
VTEHLDRTIKVEAAILVAYDRIYEIEQDIEHHLNGLRTLERRLIRLRCDLKRALEGDEG